LKVTWSGNKFDYPNMKTVDIATDKSARQKYTTQFVPGPLGTVGGGGNSGFQALNLAVQLGSRDIILVGFDMNHEAPVHWYGRNRWPMANNPDKSNFARWIEAFEAAAVPLRAMGVRVVNCSPISKLKCFPVMTVDKALEGFAV